MRSEQVTMEPLNVRTQPPLSSPV